MTDTRMSMMVYLTPDELADIDQHAKRERQTREAIVQSMLRFAAFAAKDDHECVVVSVPADPMDLHDPDFNPECPDDGVKIRAHMVAAAAGRVFRDLNFEGTRTLEQFKADHPGAVLADEQSLVGTVFHRYMAGTNPGNVFRAPHLSEYPDDPPTYVAGHSYPVQAEDELTHDLVFTMNGWKQQWDRLTDRQQQAILRPDSKAAGSTINALVRRGFRNEVDRQPTSKARMLVRWYERRSGKDAAK